MVIKYLLKLFLVFIFFVSINPSKADFFKDITSLIENNDFRLSYGVSVTDVNQDDKYEFIVTGFGFSNLALSYQNGKCFQVFQTLLAFSYDFDHFYPVPSLFCCTAFLGKSFFFGLL